MRALKIALMRWISNVYLRARTGHGAPAEPFPPARQAWPPPPPVHGVLAATGNRATPGLLRFQRRRDTRRTRPLPGWSCNDLCLAGFSLREPREWKQPIPDSGRRVLKDRSRGREGQAGCSRVAFRALPNG